jgi:hypothetical protein
MIFAWSLLLNRAEGKQVSSRLIARTLKKANLPASSRGLTRQECREHLKEAHKKYYAIRKSAPELRAKHLDSLAEAWAAEGNVLKEKILKQLIQRENIKSSHRKIKLLRGKLEHSSTTMVTVINDQQCPKDLINKIDIENAILKENAGKFQQAFNSPFYTTHLALDFGYKALTPAANQVLLGVYNPPPDTDATLLKYFEQLAIPSTARQSITNTQRLSFLCL